MFPGLLRTLPSPLPAYGFMVALCQTGKAGSVDICEEMGHRSRWAEAKLARPWGRATAGVAAIRPNSSRPVARPLRSTPPWPREAHSTSLNLSEHSSKQETSPSLR